VNVFFISARPGQGINGAVDQPSADEIIKTAGGNTEFIPLAISFPSVSFGIILLPKMNAFQKSRPYIQANEVVKIPGCAPSASSSFPNNEYCFRWAES